MLQVVVEVRLPVHRRRVMDPLEPVVWLGAVAVDLKVVLVRVEVPQLLAAAVGVLREMEPVKHGARPVVKTMADLDLCRVALAATAVAQVAGLAVRMEDLVAAAGRVLAVPAAVAAVAAIQAAAVAVADTQAAVAADRLLSERQHRSTRMLHETWPPVT